MNVTVKLDAQLCRKARHRAVDAGMSLSAWMAQLLERELSDPGESGSLLDSLAMRKFSDRDFVPERNPSAPRQVSF